MPSLYKNSVVQGDTPRPVPLAELRSKPILAGPQIDESLVLVESRAEALFALQWQQAQAELAAMKDKMLLELAEERRQTLERARLEGYQAGLNAAKAEAEKLMHEIEKGYVLLEHDRQEYVRQCQQNISDLVISCAAALLQQELNTAPEVISVLIGKAISELVTKQKLVVFVHPTRLQEVTANSHLLPLSSDGTPAIVRPDPTINPDTFRVADEIGAVLIDLPEQLRRMRKVLDHD